MYNKDSDSLNAGAPDIRLSGNQQMASDPNPEAEWRDIYDNYKQESIQQGKEYIDFEEFIEMFRDISRRPQQDSGIMAAGPGTYTQQRKQMMAGGGIAGLKQIGKPGGLVEPGISKYGMFDFITDPIKNVYDKIVDDIIPNELKNPAGALAAATAANYLPVMLPDGSDQTLIQQAMKKLGMEPGRSGLEVIQDIFTPQGTSNVEKTVKDSGLIYGQEDSSDEDAAEMMRNMGLDSSTIAKVITQPGFKLTDPSTWLGGITGAAGKVFGTGDDQYGKYTIPMAIGAAAGKAQQDYLDKQPEFPMDQTGINFQTAQQAMDNPNLRFKPKLEDTQLAAQGGRIGLKKGSKKKRSLMDLLYDEEGFNLPGFMIPASMAASSILPFLKEGGRVPAQEGGLMDLGGMEKDYRQEGGFVPIGGKEKADDVPARLSKNEFVFTADAVRAAGGGNIDKGASIMERLMDNLEAGGKVSEESQGLEGAREMFANTQKLQKRII